MLHMRLMRSLSYFTAIIYNLFYIWGVTEAWYGSIKVHQDESEFSFLHFLIDTLFAFHIVFYYPIMVMNFVIIFKEL